MGGIIRAIELGFPQQEIADASYHYQRQLDRGEKIVVGVNKYEVADEAPLEILRVDNAVERQQVERVRARKAARPQAAVRDRVADVRAAAENDRNLMPPIIAAVHAECTVGEISDIFRAVFGVYRDPAWI
jgi:methylmalonyl-CoA mutase N-terminal domain/subunit